MIWSICWEITTCYWTGPDRYRWWTNSVWLNLGQSLMTDYDPYKYARTDQNWTIIVPIWAQFFPVMACFRDVLSSHLASVRWVIYQPRVRDAWGHGSQYTKELPNTISQHLLALFLKHFIVAKYILEIQFKIVFCEIWLLKLLIFEANRLICM